MNGDAGLRAMIKKLNSLPGLPERAAPDIADACAKEIRAQIARGEGPDGEKWKPTKEGNAPLRNAAKALSVRAIGSAIVMKLTGVEALHHLGGAKGGIARRILPVRRVNESLTRAIDRVLRDAFAKEMEGA
jgi:hypothetical protein